MAYDPYSRLNQQVLDSVIIGVSLSLSFLIGYGGNIRPYHEHQLYLFLPMLVGGRLLSNYAFGLHRIQWRYIGLQDAFRTTAAYLAFSLILLLVHLSLPPRASSFQIPLSTIVVEFLLSVLGAL